MKNTTRIKFNAFVSSAALLSGIAATEANKKFAVDPVIEQKTESVVKESSEFLQAINIMPVSQQEGQVLGLGSSRSLAGRTDTSGGARREPTDPGASAEKRRYFCKQTNYDWARSYGIIDAWAHMPEFEQIMRADMLEQQALDRIMIGWNGLSAADDTDRIVNPLLQDVNEGWLFKIRDKAPEQVIDDGSLTLHSDGSDDDATKAIYIKPGVELFDEQVVDSGINAKADYSSLDALVLDAKRNIHERWRGSTDLVVIVGHDLVDDKYFNIAQETGATATEVEATDRLLRSTKQIGGLPAVRVSFFPGDAILITTLANLSIYWQEETRRRSIKDEDEYDRVANYESLNEAYVVEEYELCALVENIVNGEAPARPAP